MDVQQFVSLTPWTMIFQICNLLILCLLIKKFLFAPVQRILAKRKAEIDGIYEAAGKDRDSAAEMKKNYTQRMASARSEADALVRTANEEAARRSEAIVDEARRQAAGIVRKAEEDIRLERRKAYLELKKDLSGMAVDIAEKMIDREINESDQRVLVEDFIKNAGDEQ